MKRDLSLLSVLPVLAVFAFTVPSGRSATLVLHWALDDGIANPAGTLAVDDGQDVLTPGADPAGVRDGGFVNFGSSAILPLWETSGGVNGGGYLRFNGSADATTGYAMRFSESDGSLPSGPAYTISVWFRIDGNGTTGDMGGLLGGLFSTANNRYFEVNAWYSLDGGTSASEVVSATNRGTGFATAASAATPGWFDGSWHHAAAVFSSTSFRSLYVDGTLVASSTTLASAAVDPVRFSIGALDRPATADFFSGDLDEVSLYRGALTDLEIAALYAAAVPEPTTGAFLLAAALFSGRRRRDRR